MLKIITGSAKGKVLKTLEGEATRPTSSRVKEALFSSIQFDIAHRAVLDLFAGSGGLGLEALSRGAASCIFIDSSREAIDIVKQNATGTGFFSVSKYLVSDYRNYIRKASGRDRFDLVFIDPPYAMLCAKDALDRLVKADMLRDGAIVCIEGGCEEIGDDLNGFEVLKRTSYGKMTYLLILLYRKPESDADGN